MLRRKLNPPQPVPSTTKRGLIAFTTEAIVILSNWTKNIWQFKMATFAGTQSNVGFSDFQSFLSWTGSHGTNGTPVPEPLSRSVSYASSVDPLYSPMLIRREESANTRSAPSTPQRNYRRLAESTSSLAELDPVVGSGESMDTTRLASQLLLLLQSPSGSSLFQVSAMISHSYIQRYAEGDHAHVIALWRALEEHRRFRMADSLRDSAVKVAPALVTVPIPPLAFCHP